MLAQKPAVRHEDRWLRFYPQLSIGRSWQRPVQDKARKTQYPLQETGTACGKRRRALSVEEGPCALQTRAFRSSPRPLGEGREDTRAQTTPGVP